MASFSFVFIMSIQPDNLDRVFPRDIQKYYAKAFLKRGGMTRSRSEYFVRLWGYLQWKHQVETHGPNTLVAIEELSLLPEFVSCSHREAAILFYPDGEKGSERSAGMMLDRLVALGLLDKQFDGQTQCWKIREHPEFVTIAAALPEVLVDHFDPAIDAVQTAKLLTRSFSELVRDEAMTAHKITKCLRQWSKVYSGCIRVFRRQDTQNPVGVIILYPTAESSDRLFFDTPSKGLYLTNTRSQDPFEMALPGDPTCTCLLVRAWFIEPDYLNAQMMALLISTTQSMTVAMRQDYPALCDMFSLVIHPSYEQLRNLMGFETTAQDRQRHYKWIYLAIDRYLAIDAEATIAALTAGLPSPHPKESP
jgi:hypothetical protein